MVTVQPVDWLAVAPSLAPAVGAVLVLLLDSAWGTRVRPLIGWLSLSAPGCGLVAVGLLWGERRDVFCVPGNDSLCSYSVDATTLAFQGLVLAGSVVVVLMSWPGTLDDRVPLAEHHFLLLCSVCGGAALAASRDLVTLVVALETLSLPGFALVGLRRRDGRGAEAAVKYFLVSVVSIAVMAFGISLVYGSTGSVYLDRIAQSAPTRAAGSVAAVGMLLTLTGLAFKVSAVPFHVWVPDTYVGAPVPVAAYLSVVSKAAAFGGLIVVLTRGFSPFESVWGPAVAVAAGLSMSVGNLAALRQRHAVRLLAWSAVAQAGYMLVPLAVVAASDNPAVERSAAAATLGYLAVYSLVTLGAFAVVAAVGREQPAHRLSGYHDLARRRPWTALALAFALLALAGLPPGLIGLFAKVVVFRAAVDGGLGWLAVVTAVNVAIGLAYYLRWAARLFQPTAAEPASVHRLPVPLALAIGATLVAAVAASALPDLLFGELAQAAAVTGR